MLVPVSLAGMISLAGMAYGAVAAVRPDPPPSVRVDVFAQHSGGKIVYTYRVFNNSQRDITAIAIGLDTLNDENPLNDIYELFELPSGWNSKYGIPTTSSTSPTGWRASVAKPEQGDSLAISWEPLNNTTPRLFAGQVMGKMGIAVDRPDVNYLTGHARVIFTEGDPLNLTVPVESLDKTPPSLTVNLKPGILQSADKKLVPVNVTFTIKDDYDRQPEIKLESITANEPLEPDDIGDASFGMDDRYLMLRAAHNGDADRIYTVTYSATDASGNQTTASATVTVPHGQSGLK
jgi:hypothetical protein